MAWDERFGHEDLGDGARLVWLGPDDADDISRLAGSILYDVYPYEKRETVDLFLEETQSPDAIRCQMAGGMRYAAIKVGDDLAGYTAFGPDGDSVTLSKLYLLEGYRGRGLGSKVMGYVESTAEKEGFRSVHLDMNGRNTGAIALYSRRGYVETRREDLGYVLVVMEKPLRI